ncbi:MAG: ATP-binding cassette domain-containing protein [Methanobacteriota archaeon]
MQQAARFAKIHEFISALPDGYEILVGERGIRLSGGERQRVAIGRAILKNAPVLIMDEAISNLDTGTELIIRETFAS